jgi:hypothetical protein
MEDKSIIQNGSKTEFKVKVIDSRLRYIEVKLYHVSCTDGKISVIIILITFFSTVVPLTSCFHSCRPFVVNATFRKGLVVSSVSWLGQLTVGV